MSLKWGCCSNGRMKIFTQDVNHQMGQRKMKLLCLQAMKFHFMFGFALWPSTVQLESRSWSIWSTRSIWFSNCALHFEFPSILLCKWLLSLSERCKIKYFLLSSSRYAHICILCHFTRSENDRTGQDLISFKYLGTPGPSAPCPVLGNLPCSVLKL